MTYDKENKLNIAIPLIIYWIILVIFQFSRNFIESNVLEYAIKISLLMYLCFSFFRISKGKFYNLIPLTIVSFIIFISFSQNVLSLKTIVYYSFILIFIILIYGVGDKYNITLKNYELFLKVVIGVCLLSSLYSFVFCFDQFKNIFHIDIAYGNELKSFYDSSHIYGLYLSAGIISSIIMLEQNKNKKIFYILSILVFLLNLILTFSRTAIVATICFVVMFVLFSKEKKLKCIMFFSLISILLVYLFIPSINDFVNNIVFKDGNMADRDSLVEVALNLFSEFKPFQKIFGAGSSNVQKMIFSLTMHDNTHNAYIEILLYFGIFGLTCFVSLLIGIFIKQIKFMKINHQIGKNLLCITTWCMLVMMANTFVIFTSSIENYFLTIFAIVFPKYLCNYFKKELL